MRSPVAIRMALARAVRDPVGPSRIGRLGNHALAQAHRCVIRYRRDPFPCALWRDSPNRSGQRSTRTRALADERSHPCARALRGWVVSAAAVRRMLGAVLALLIGAI